MRHRVLKIMRIAVSSLMPPGFEKYVGPGPAVPWVPVGLTPRMPVVGYTGHFSDASSDSSSLGLNIGILFCVNKIYL